MRQLIKNLVGKHAKAALTDLENQGLLTPQVRKVILDNFNNLFRDWLKEVEQSSERD